MNELINKGKILLHTNYHETIEELSKTRISQPKSSIQTFDFEPINRNLNSKVNLMGDLRPILFDVKNGESYFRKSMVSAYDESINKFECLEGEAYLTAHSLVKVGKKYVPYIMLTFYFYTRSKNILEGKYKLRYSEQPQVESKIDYMKDKIDFLIKHTPRDSILLIDGPFIAGDSYTYLVSKLNLFLEKNILPIFFVKNSSSNMVTESIETIKGKYNSDNHWAYNFLKTGERTPAFQYVDQGNNKNSKVFYYIKPFNLSPQRVEVPLIHYNKYKENISDILDMINYLIIVQGNHKNPQVRPIAIAEKYAREVITLNNLNGIISKSKLVPTLNQERFAWS